MSTAIPLIPEMKVGLVVVTPTIIKNITTNKKYVVQRLEEGHIIIYNDLGELCTYSAYEFIEADLYYTMCLFSTVINIFKLGNKAYK